MKDIIIRSGEVIAAEINYIKRKTQETMLSAAVEIGRLLCEAKNSVPYGDWGKWLEENVDYSTSTANDLMKLYNEYGEKDQQSLFADNSAELFAMLSPSQALALTALPKEERTEFVQSHDMESLSVRKLKEELAQIKAEKAAEKKASDKRIADLGDSLMSRNADLQQANGALKAAREDKEAADKRVRELDATLKESAKENGALKAKIAELEAEPKTVEVQQMSIDTDAIRIEIEAEFADKMQSLEAKNAALSEETEALTRKLSAASSAVVQKFAVHFALWQQEYQTLVNLLGEVEGESPEQAEKLKGALAKTAQTMVGEAV